MTVNKAPQTITFTPPISSVTFGASPIAFAATGGASGNPVVFSVDPSSTGAGTFSGSMLTITGAGTLVIDANQAANTNYAAATQVQQSIVVQKAPQAIAFPLAASTTLGSGAITLSATGGASGNPVTFSLVSGPGTVSGSTLTITGIGQVVVAANQAGNAKYLAAPQLNKGISVNLAALTALAPGSVLAGSSATFSWTAGSAVTSYQLKIGTIGVGSSNLYSGAQTTATSANVTGLPLLGATVYAQPLSEIGGTWYTANYTYTETLPPAVSLSAASIAFGVQTIGTTSASQTVTLTNTGGTTLSITSIAVTGVNASYFAFSNTCGTSLAAGANCANHGHFAPTTGGAKTAAVTITDSAAGSPQSIALTGTGGTTVSLSSTIGAFGVEEIGATTASKQFTLTNTGAVALTISSISVTGANASSFVFANSCGTSLAAGANCLIHGHFTPTLAGALTATASMTDSGIGSPHMITLTGTGAALNSTTVSFSPPTLTFASQAVGTTSATQAVTLTNTGAAGLAIVLVKVTGTNASSFAASNTCGSGVPAGGSCTFHVHFAPTGTGTLTGAVSITDSATGSPQTIALTGTGH